MYLRESHSLLPAFVAVPGLSVQNLARRPALNRLGKAIAAALASTGLGLTISHLAVGQPAEQIGEERGGDARIDEVLVTGRQPSRQGVDRSALSKLTEDLLDTPQSITTLSRELLENRGINSLNDALRNVAGITLGAGEFSWQGNNPNIRGFNARDDMYLDGIRDFGSYPRDPFNLETIEVLSGPSSILFGRGSTGGAINQVTKQPTLDVVTDVSVNIGSEGTLRGAADVARPVPLLGDGAAFRINLLAHSGEVAERDGAQTERFGIAPSLALPFGDATRLTFGYMKQSSDDRPDYGLPWLAGRPAPVPRQNFYGFESDYLETDADIGTAQLTHAVGESVALNAQVRYAHYSRETRITEPLITQTVPPSTALADVSVFRYVFISDSEETLLTGQVAATMELETGAVGHALVTGVEVSREESTPTFAFGIGAPSTNLLLPNPSDPFTATTTDPRIQADTRAETVALYALDTLKVGDAWQLTLGIRWDRFDTDYDAERFAGPPTPFNAGNVSGSESFTQVDDIVSYRAGLVYKTSPSASIYLAASTSFNPSGQSLSFLATGRGLGLDNIALDPEKNRSLEAGLKMDLHDGALSFAGAVFEITKTNARVPDPGNPGFNTLGGEQRVRGMSLESSGMLTERWYWSSGYTYLDSEVVKAAPGAATGAALANAPEHSLSLWSNYQLTDRFDFGIGARYVAEQLAQNTGSGKSVPSYRLFDAMARYRVSDAVAFKLNLANIGDELYFDQLHPWHVVPGPGFTATFAVNVTY
jgi:catecholate siderophore receptor